MYMKSPRHENAQRKLVHFSTKKKKKEKKNPSRSWFNGWRSLSTSRILNVLIILVTNFERCVLQKKKKKKRWWWRRRSRRKKQKRGVTRERGPRREEDEICTTGFHISGRKYLNFSLSRRLGKQRRRRRHSIELNSMEKDKRNYILKQNKQNKLKKKKQNQQQKSKKKKKKKKEMEKKITCSCCGAPVGCDIYFLLLIFDCFCLCRKSICAYESARAPVCVCQCVCA